MREHGMPFNDEMVRATLGLRKTVTRRLVNSRNSECATSSLADVDLGKAFIDGNGALNAPDRHGPSVHRILPKWRRGHTLWVREAFATFEGAMGRGVVYRADPNAGGYVQLALCIPDRWRPSIHMPRWASRITLDVRDVRPERLRDITEADAMAEGVKPMLVEVMGQGVCERSHKAAFEVLWDGIYAKRGLGWESNPLVWRVEYKVKEVKA
ncbi:MAG: hypothetical protein FWF84_05085 [Kiritimatiellaeota bacterium]|nr:hypothetical protein [Kiritimatiellota bacterium]